MAGAAEFKLDGIYLAAMLHARRGRGPDDDAKTGDAVLAILDELGVDRGEFQSYLDEHGEELQETLAWIGV
ncbi:MAG TPA: hypothetical protein VM658_00290 [bacterium]|nr:hypothetical protein [bacterium]